MASSSNHITLCVAETTRCIQATNVVVDLEAVLAD